MAQIMMLDGLSSYGAIRGDLGFLGSSETDEIAILTKDGWSKFTPDAYQLGRFKTFFPLGNKVLLEKGKKMDRFWYKPGHPTIDFVAIIGTVTSGGGDKDIYDELMQMGQYHPHMVKENWFVVFYKNGGAEVKMDAEDFTGSYFTDSSMHEEIFKGKGIKRVSLVSPTDTKFPSLIFKVGRIPIKVTSGTLSQLEEKAVALWNSMTPEQQQQVLTQTNGNPSPQDVINFANQQGIKEAGMNWTPILIGGGILITFAAIYFLMRK